MSLLVCEEHLLAYSTPLCPRCEAAGAKEDFGRDYDSLDRVLERALKQASMGKGKARHANGEPFHEQQICTLNRYLGSTDGAVFQACKKAIESKRLPKDAAVAELLGAIVYLAAAVIVREEQP